MSWGIKNWRQFASYKQEKPNPDGKDLGYRNVGESDPDTLVIDTYNINFSQITQCHNN